MDFDASRLRRGEWLAGASAVLLAIFLVGGKWYGGAGRTGGSLTGWQALTDLRWLLLVTIVAAVGLVFTQATRRAPALPGDDEPGRDAARDRHRGGADHPRPDRPAAERAGGRLPRPAQRDRDHASAAISRCARRASRAGTRRRTSRSYRRARAANPRMAGQMLDREQVLHVARLARLELSEDEVERMAAELSKVLDHIEKIRELDLEGVPPTSHVVDVVNALRARRARAVPAARSRLWRQPPSRSTAASASPAPARRERADRPDGRRRGRADPRRRARPGRAVRRLPGARGGRSS